MMAFRPKEKQKRLVRHMSLSRQQCETGALALQGMSPESLLVPSG
jgi:hypothetical protein